ncbi:unnamed protein product [marine sediment metagenome]|uniref:Uncharacterized protein n=1 Tax=marine sediment metagenome TaxID=412755 RepID=X1HL41_9ZZZZ
MGLTPSKKLVPEEAPSTLGTVANLLPLLKNLDPDQLGALVDKFVGGGEEVAPEGDLTGMLMDYVSRNPEMLEGLLEGLKGKGNAGAGEIASQV